MIQPTQIKMHRGRLTLVYDSTNDFGVTPVKVGPTEIPPPDSFIEAMKALRPVAARWAEVKLGDGHEIMPHTINIAWNGSDYSCKIDSMRVLKRSTSPLNQPTPTKFSPQYEGSPNKDRMDGEDAAKVNTLINETIELIRKLPEREPTLFDNVVEEALAG